MDGFIVMEIQTDATGKVATLPPIECEDRDHADSVYYGILSAAAISKVYCHSAVMLTKDGGYETSKAYYHTTGKSTTEGTT